MKEITPVKNMLELGLKNDVKRKLSQGLYLSLFIYNFFKKL